MRCAHLYLISIGLVIFTYLCFVFYAYASWVNRLETQIDICGYYCVTADQQYFATGINNMKHIKEAAAVIIKDGKLFAIECGYGNYKGWWEFSGGKLEDREKAEDACVREIREELGATVQVQKLLDVVEYDYPEFHLAMHCFLCALPEGEHLVLHEHCAAKWLTKDELHSVKRLPADLSVLEVIAVEMG